MDLERRHQSLAEEQTAALDSLEVSPHRIPARAWPGDLHGLSDPGLYSWWVDSAGARDLSDGLGHPVVADRIYAGQAGATAWPSGRTYVSTLRSRIGSHHLRGNIRGSTFRWTLASALRSPIGLHATGPRKLEPDSEKRLTAWIKDHLELAVHPFAERDPLGHLEHAVLLKLDPPLNLDGMPMTPLRAKLSRLRRDLSGGESA